MIKKMKFDFRIGAQCRRNPSSSRGDGHQYKQRRPPPNLSIDLHIIYEMFAKNEKYLLWSCYHFLISECIFVTAVLLKFQTDHVTTENLLNWRIVEGHGIRYQHEFDE